MGDLFHVWVGHRQFETPEIAAVMVALDRLRAAGVRVSYIEGNRDFFLRDGPYRDHFDEVAVELPIEIGNERVLCVHGDGLNDRDWQYRGWRWLSKSPPARFFVRHLPGGLARRIVHGTEERLARTNFKHKNRIPEEPIATWGARRLIQGEFDRIVLGHFHEPRLIATQHGKIHILDAWFRSHRIESLDGLDVEQASS